MELMLGLMSISGYRLVHLSAVLCFWLRNNSTLTESTVYTQCEICYTVGLSTDSLLNERLLHGSETVPNNYRDCLDCNSEQTKHEAKSS